MSRIPATNADLHDKQAIIATRIPNLQLRISELRYTRKSTDYLNLWRANLMVSIVENCEWYKIALVPPKILRRHERHDDEKVGEIIESIVRAASWTHPIVVDEQDFIILDGHHRFEAATRLRLARIPCALVDYDAPIVRVDAWRRDEVIDRGAVRRAAFSGRPMPIQTSRHSFSAPIVMQPIALARLSEEQPAHA